MKGASAFLLLLIVHGICLGQGKTGNAKTGGPCSPAVTGNNNTFHFEYCGSDPEEGKRIIKLLRAVSDGENLTNSKLDEILDILGQPVKINIQDSSSESYQVIGVRPKASIEFYTEDPVDRGQFEITCDRPCMSSSFCPLQGTNAGNFAIVLNHPELAEFLFQRQFPPFVSCTLTVESMDEKPVKIIDIKASRRNQDIRFPKKQPLPRVNAGGSSIQ